MPEGRLFGLDAQTVIQVIAQFINLAILAFILAKLLYRPVSNFLKNRADNIQTQFARAADEMTNATALKQEYEAKMQDIERERADILDQARAAATETGRRIVAEATQNADSIKERAAANIQLEWERAQSELRATIIDVSTVMAEKFITISIDDETRNRLYDEATSELEGMTWQN